jgi:protein tyrosine/serine phosphatase
VIDLRDDAVPWEKSAVTKNGMTYVHIPSNAARTNATTIASFLTAVTESERPIYIHCRRGRDRTGLEVACYRLVHQQDHWTREKAIEELRAHGQQRLFFPGIERYLRTFNPQDFTPMPRIEAVAPVPAGG